MEQKKEMQGVQHLDHFPLLSNQHTVSHQPDKFIIDFRGIYPQFAPDNKPQVVVTHKVVILDPYVAKDLLDNLRNNLEKYEERFGKIKESDALKKVRKENKKKAGKSKKKPRDTLQRPSYMG